MESNKQLELAWSRILARAWADEVFKEQLLANPNAVLKKNGFPIPSDIHYTILEDQEDLANIVIHNSSHHFEYEDAQRMEKWATLIEDVKSHSKLKKELLSNPVEVMKRYGLVVPPRKTYKIVFDTEDQKYLVLKRQSGAPISEIELKRVAAGVSVSGGFCTDTSC